MREGKMNRLKKEIWGLAVMVLLLGCGHEPHTPNEPQGETPPAAVAVNAAGTSASGAYWAATESDRPVLCWSETAGSDGEYVLRFAEMGADGKMGQAMTVEGSKGMQAHGESMAKMQFKGNGDVVAVFRRAAPSPENRFAGGLFYTQSFDRGASWSAPARLVDAETSPSQSFFDLARLPNGELGMVWLDGRRLTPEQNGSCLLFAKTNGRTGFDAPRVIKTGVCQCCRTDLFVSSDTQLQIAFRDIIQDSIRDMVTLVSNDLGESFAPEARISEDNWVVAGCPHTGPSIAKTAEGFGYLWYTQGGGPGVYFTSGDGLNFHDRELVSADGFHPQMLGLPDHSLAMVMEEYAEQDSLPFNQISLFHRSSDGKQSKRILSQAGIHSTFPVLMQLDAERIAVAWNTDEDSVKNLMYWQGPIRTTQILP